MLKSTPAVNTLALLSKQPVRSTASRLGRSARTPSISTARLHSSTPTAGASALRPGFSITQLRAAQPILCASRLAGPLSLRSFSSAPTSVNPPPNPAPAGGASPQLDPSSNSNPNSSSDQSTAQPDAQTVAQKLRSLFRTHGWSALVVYLFLSALDFGLSFAVIWAVGADRVREAEDAVLDGLGWRRKDGGPGKVRQAVTEWSDKRKSPEKLARDEERREQRRAEESEKKARLEEEGEAAAGGGGYGAVASTAVLAYVIHKTALLPVRVGVTVAITPRVVRTLQKWGWKVGYNQGAPASADAMAKAAHAQHKAAKAAAKEAKRAAKAA